MALWERNFIVVALFNAGVIFSTFPLLAAMGYASFYASSLMIVLFVMLTGISAYFLRRKQWDWALLFAFMPAIILAVVMLCGERSETGFINNLHIRGGEISVYRRGVYLIVFSCMYNGMMRFFMSFEVAKNDEVKEAYWLQRARFPPAVSNDYEEKKSRRFQFLLSALSGLMTQVAFFFIFFAQGFPADALYNGLLYFTYGTELRYVPFLFVMGMGAASIFLLSMGKTEKAFFMAMAAPVIIFLVSGFDLYVALSFGMFILVCVGALISDLARTYNKQAILLFLFLLTAYILIKYKLLG